ncbi:RNA ligase family protein [Streptomyces sp. NPDC020141]|uniref:RNA ligase family protein n=1 Tax=Streptomyces sp. NPDC020141 TaxID=3365065 RepID=UPI0037B52069
MSLREKSAMREESRLLEGFTFQEWPKTPRLFREIVITEKIDGTNAAIHIRENEGLAGTYSIAAQSRRRLITPTNDNYGFAAWVHANASDLIHILGPGSHFGEWWGQGIQRRYGMETRSFSLFNVIRWGTQTDEDGTTMKSRAEQSNLVDQVDAVPILYRGVFDQDVIDEQLKELLESGSYAAPGFMNPEGICVYHTQTRSVFKVTLDNHDAGKWAAV